MKVKLDIKIVGRCERAKEDGGWVNGHCELSPTIIDLDTWDTDDLMSKIEIGVRGIKKSIERTLSHKGETNEIQR